MNLHLVHTGSHDIGPRGGCRICQRRRHRVRRVAGALARSAKPRGLTLLALMVVTSYVICMACAAVVVGFPS